MSRTIFSSETVNNITACVECLKRSSQKISFTSIQKVFWKDEGRKKHHRLDTAVIKISKRLKLMSSQGWLSLAQKALKDNWKDDTCHHPPPPHWGMRLVFWRLFWNLANKYVGFFETLKRSSCNLRPTQLAPSQLYVNRQFSKTFFSFLSLI